MTTRETGAATQAQDDVCRLADLYCETKDRIVGLLDDPDAAQWNRPVPACPGWSVRDVVAHLTAVALDLLDGRLTVPPSDADTAEHVRRFDGCDEDELFSIWAGAADRLVQSAATAGLEPPLGDIACHEHDIRAALGRPGARDAESVHWTARELLAMLQPPVPLRVITEDGQYRTGPCSGPEILLRTTLFDTMRWRLGRRSRLQMAAMDWSEDPAPVLDHLYLFGPARTDIIE
ncbi:maleylpyruvate isomerase family mycothiol-dependent enzyme [Mycolicibacterium poriferae]|uniref:maleylpyruvate isomerase family mycothiol-dependent enzyme n=1 Tax=Mycolicibacterium poriferae TaxID=39694 RepID=UPI0024BB71A1|nr:maleylpyruvate isomerase family mycothiol-dependent enzyme [Mycolicibacterium poriferae]